MNVEEIRKYCLDLPETHEKLQWGDALCFKVREKMFAVMGLDRIRLTFKCTPEKFAELIERENISKAPYLGHRNWVMLDRLDALRSDELQNLLKESYEMVAAKAPVKNRKAKKRPKTSVARKKPIGARGRKKTR